MTYHYVAKVPLAMASFVRDNPNDDGAHYEHESFLLDLVKLEQDALQAGGDYDQAYREAALAIVPDEIKSRLGELMLLMVNRHTEERAFVADDIIRFVNVLEEERDGLMIPTFIADSQTQQQVQIR